MQELNLSAVRKRLNVSEEKNKILDELLTPPLTREKVKKLTEISLYYRKAIPQENT